jgi:predicted extracellular nuclease
MLRSIALTAIIGALVVLSAPTGQARRASSASLVISEVYGGGGNAGAPYTHDFVELRNRGSVAVSLAGWSVQYAGATSSSWTVTPLPSVTLPAGKYFLVQQASGGANGAPLPNADAIGTTAMAVASGKVAVLPSTVALSGTCPTGPADLVGYGTANCFEGSGAAPPASNTLSDQRKGNGATDTDENAADFDALAPTPQNTQSPTSAVTLRFFTAERVASAVLLRWRTAAEVGILRFDVYCGSRHVGAAPSRARENPNVDGATYTLRDARPPTARVYRLRETRLDGSHAWIATARVGGAITRPG